MPAALKTIVRPPLNKILRYGDPDLKIVPTCSVHEVQPRERYGRDAMDGQSAPQLSELSEEMRNMVALILDAIQELPAFRYAESLMAESAKAGEPAPVALAQTGNTPMPAEAEAKAQERDPAKVLKQQAAPTPPPAKQQLPPPPQPIRNQKPIIDGAIRSRYARLVADSKDKKLTYEKRQESLSQAQLLHEQTAGASKEIVARAIKRATITGVSYERALWEESAGQELSLPWPPAWCA